MNNSEVVALSKLYYSIGEVAEMFQVNASLLRFWEKEFQIVIAKKNLKGNRLYSQKEIARIREIYDLVKIQGYTLDGAKQFINQHKKPKKNEGEMASIISHLESIKQRLISLKSS